MTLVLIYTRGFIVKLGGKSRKEQEEMKVIII